MSKYLITRSKQMTPQYSYSSGYGLDEAAAGGLFGILASIGIFVYLIALAVAVLLIVANWKIFSKAGEPGWAAIIPFYNSYVMFKIAWGNGILFLLQFIPIVGVIIGIICNFKLAKAFGKDGGFGVGLWLLPVIFYPMLAFGSAEYKGVSEQ